MNPVKLTIVICLIVTVIAYAIMFYIAGKRKSDKKKGTLVEKSPKSEKGLAGKGGRESIENKIGIEKITDNVIIEKNGRVNIVLEYSTPDIPSLKDEEVNLYENKMMRTAVSLKCDIKTIEFAGTVKTIKANTHILETVQRGVLTEQAADYAKQLAKSLGDKQFDRKEVEKKKYVVVGAKEEGIDKSIEQLKKYVESIITNLTKAGIKVNMLETTGLIDHLNEVINFGTKLDVEIAEAEGVFELYATGGTRAKGRY